MDEATSALDDSTEKEIVEEIKHLKGKITMIVIAHRLSTVQNCDRIYRLEKVGWSRKAGLKNIEHGRMSDNNNTYESNRYRKKMMKFILNMTH